MTIAPWDTTVSKSFCPPTLIPAASSPDVVMVPDDLTVTGPALLPANTPSASVVKMPNGPVAMFKFTGPVVAKNSTPMSPASGVMLLVSPMTLSVVNGGAPPIVVSATPKDTLPEQVTVVPPPLI